MVPSHYDIRLDLDIDTFTFTGSVGIDIGVVETVDEIVLNSAEVDIRSASLVDGPEISSIGYDEDKEMATLGLSASLAPGSYRLEIEHSGIINDQLRGLYQAFYRDSDGNQHPIATSQCQSTDARRIFPCWDEPDFKATYQTTMVVADGLEAYSKRR